MKIITALLALIWFLGWGFWFLYERGHIDLSATSEQKDPVGQKVDTVAMEPQSEVKKSFLLGNPYPRDSVDFVIDSLMKDRTSGQTIQVISYYAEEEPYTGNNGNLGIQRSINLIQNARKRYAGRVLQPVGLKLKSEMDTTGISSWYKVVRIGKKVPLRILDNQRVLVFFPFAKGDESALTKISRPLDSLSNIWNNENNRLIITGYTDNTADETTNYNLGLERAKSIQEMIVASGFPENRITTLSRGEKNPISTNNTYDGRYLNRRVEIIVDK